MKKFIKWFLYSIVACGAIALAVCYMVIPERTKAAADVVIGYMNTPICIIGGTTITVGVIAGIIIKFIYDRHKDSVKKELDSVKNDFEAKKQEVADKYDELQKQYEEKQKEFEEKLEELKNTLITLSQIYSVMEEDIYNTFKLIPNKKVQEKVEELYGREERINNEAEEE